MNAGRSIDFAELFARAANSPPVAQEPRDSDHVVDEDLLLRWSAGELGTAEEASLLGHLADCPQCRREVAAMVRIGALILPEPPTEEDPLLTRPVAGAAEAMPARRAMRRRRTTVLAIVSVVAVLALVVFFPDFVLDRPQRQLAMARRDLAEGRLQVAMERAESLLGKPLSPTRREEAAALLEESVYRAGRDELQQGRFAAVTHLRDRLTRHGESSGRVANLAIQAQRGVPSEVQLARAGSLTDYGYTLRGYSGTKALPAFDPKTESAREQLAQAAEQYPDSVPVLLNYGQFLLDEAAYDEARALFGRAAALEPQNPHVAMAQGLLAFDEDRIEEALSHFQRAAELDPARADAELNQAIALERLDRRNEARKHFEHAAQLGDAAMREKIERFLGQ